MIPEDQLSDADLALKRELGDLPEVTILHLIYQHPPYESEAKDYEFSATSMREHWDAGYRDTTRTLRRREWLTMPGEDVGIKVHDVHHAEEEG